MVFPAKGYMMAKLSRACLSLGGAASDVAVLVISVKRKGLGLER